MIKKNKTVIREMPYCGGRQKRMLEFLYGSLLGRVLLRFLVCRFVSRLVGLFMNTSFSARFIKGFVTKNGIDMSRFEDREYKSYNDFFTRRLKHEPDFCMENSALCAPCDSRLSVYEIHKNSTFRIKNSAYTLSGMLKNEKLAGEFEGGFCLVFRLCVDDYHRYCYFDSCSKGDNVFIPGRLHTVNPIALAEFDIYSENCREYTVLETQNFGKAVEVEIGAMCVGKIVNFHRVGSFFRGEEKGRFDFGGSTIVLLLQKGAASIDERIFQNSASGIETKVKIGERIGVAINQTSSSISF